MVSPFRYKYIVKVGAMGQRPLFFGIIIVIILLLTVLIYIKNIKNPNRLTIYNLIYDYTHDICRDLPNVKYYRSSQFDSRINKLFNSCFPENSPFCKKADLLLKTLGKYGSVFIEGGVIRDLINGHTQVNDIDIAFSIDNKTQIESVCNSLNLESQWIYEDKVHNYVFVTFSDSIEGHTIHKVSLQGVENDVNCMLYDYKSKVIIDPCGSGFINNLNMQFRIVQPTFDVFFHRIDFSGNVDKKAPLRIFKMFHKGYTIENYGNKNTESFRSWFRMNLKKMKTDFPFYDDTYGTKTPILPWVMFRSIRGDIIDEKTGQISKVGKNGSKLKETLSAIKKFDKSIYLDIMNDLQKYDKNIYTY